MATLSACGGDGGRVTVHAEIRQSAAADFVDDEDGDGLDPTIDDLSCEVRGLDVGQPVDCVVAFTTTVPAGADAYVLRIGDLDQAFTAREARRSSKRQPIVFVVPTPSDDEPEG